MNRYPSPRLNIAERTRKLITQSSYFKPTIEDSWGESYAIVGFTPVNMHVMEQNLVSWFDDRYDCPSSNHNVVLYKKNSPPLVGDLVVRIWDGRAQEVEFYYETHSLEDSLCWWLEPSNTQQIVERFRELPEYLQQQLWKFCSSIPTPMRNKFWIHRDFPATAITNAVKAESHFLRLERFTIVSPKAEAIIFHKNDLSLIQSFPGLITTVHLKKVELCPSLRRSV